MKPNINEEQNEIKINKNIIEYNSKDKEDFCDNEVIFKNNSDKKEILINNKDNNLISEQLISDNSFLNKKTKFDHNDNEIDTSKNENDNKIKKIEEDKNTQKYDYGYSIILLEDNEEGLMEDFLESPIEHDISDFYNYNLDEEKWQKILHHSILVHYEKHLKEEMEKRKKMQNMFMFNMNINMNNNIIPPSMMPQMNSLMMGNLNNSNGINYSMQTPAIQNMNKNKNIQNANNK